MKKVISLLSLSILMLGSCQDFDYGDIPTPIDEEALNNAALVLGIKVDATHDWSTIQKGTVTIIFQIVGKTTKVLNNKPMPLF